MHALRTILTAVLALAAVSAAAETLEPFDEAPQDPELVAVRDTLVEAVEARDPGALLPHVAPDVKLSFGGEEGRAALRDALRTDPSLWDELHWILTHGGGFSDGMFLAPYTFAGDTAADPFSAGIVTASDVNLRASPDTNALVMDRLSHAVVEVVDWEAGEFGLPGGWARVALPDGRHGYMARRYLRSPIDHRVLFEKADGGWRISSFLAGD